MGSQIPRKKKRVGLNVEQLLNEIFVDSESQANASYNGADNTDEEGVAGKIIRIKLQNFMCHDNLEFNFGEKINFISGKNGSGKSAILTALVIGLGGRTTETNRGHSIKNLIQKGKTKATIEITLNNAGPRKFKPHLYGNAIKIVRSISNNSSQYKIMSQRDEVISTKRDDIDLINLYFNIQVANPVIILNQDTARTFLKSAAEKDLYNIFMKGTYLEEIETRNSSLKNDKIPTLESLIDDKKKVLQGSYEDINQYREKLIQIKELNKNQNKAQNIQNELFWAHVHKIEKKLDAQKTIAEECEKQLPSIRDKVNKRDKIAQELKDKQKSCESKLKEVKTKMQDIENDSMEKEQSLKKSKEQIALKMNEIKKVQKKIISEKNICQEIQSEIDNHESRSAEIESKKSALESQIKELTKTLEELRAVKSTTLVHQQQLSDTNNALTLAYSKREEFCKNLKRKLEYKEDNLRSLKTEKNKLIVYSKWMPELVDNIEKAHKAGKFIQKPRGPLGSFIKVNENQWGPAIENYIGAKKLSSFCVDNHQDFKVFKMIIDRLDIPANLKPSVSISKFINQVHDVRRNETGTEKYKNLFRSISISDPIVANALIDSMGPETILLIPTSEEAYGILEDIRYVPRNCKRAFTLNGDLFYPSPNYRSYAGTVKEGTRYLQVSQVQAIKYAQQEINNIKNELGKHALDLETAKGEVAKSVENLSEVNREVIKLDKKIAAVENKLDELKKEELPEMYNVNILKEDLEFRQKNVETCENKIKELESQSEELRGSFKDLKENVEKIVEEKNKKRDEINKLETEIQELNSEHYKITEKSGHYISLLKSEESKLANTKQNITKLEGEVKKAEKEAMKVHPERIKQTLEVETLEKDLHKINGLIRVLEKNIGDVNAIPADYHLRLKQLLDNRATLENLTNTANKMKETILKLGEVYKRVKELVTVSTKCTFVALIQKKNFIGDMIIDHEKKSLKVIIKVETAAKDKSSTLTLSGGERSYSMVSFILALWNNMQSPFFFLDEFDVFMDELNRNMIMAMLLEHAKTNSEQQFVFLTPHANINNELLKDVQFFRMRDPRGEENMSEE